MGWARNGAKKGPQPPESPQKTQRKQVLLPDSEKSLKIIEQLKELGKEAHLNARNTKKCYNGHVKCGQEWLTGYFPGGDSIPVVTNHDLPRLGASEPDDTYSDPSFQAAFNCIPNHCSDKALFLFLTFKGFHQNLGKGTVEGI